MYTLTGVLKLKKDIQQVTDTFKKREFVVTDGSGNYPQDILFQLTQDRVNLIDDMNANEMVTVTFNLRGREWTNPQGEVVYFNSLDAWRVEKAQGGMPVQGTQNQAQPQSNIQQVTTDNVETLMDEGDDDLPF